MSGFSSGLFRLDFDSARGNTMASNIGRVVPRTMDLGFIFRSQCVFESSVYPGIGYAGSEQLIWQFRDALLPQLSSCSLETHLCDLVTYNDSYFTGNGSYPCSCSGHRTKSVGMLPEKWFV